jgi:hypothetical protein
VFFSYNSFSFLHRFYEVACFKSTLRKKLGPIFGEDFVERAFKVLKFSIKALSALGNEIFRLTPETRGGLMLIMIIFFSAWVLGATIFVETHGHAKNCGSIGMCTYSLMRLTFFDGNGLDLAYSLLDGYRFLFFVCMLYMCITSFGIINGLVGIFGTLFATASFKAFEEEEDDIKYGREKVDSPEEEEDSEEDNNDETNNNDNDDNLPEENGLDNNNNNNNNYNVVPLGEFTEKQKKSASDLFKSVQGEGPALSEGELKSALKGALGKQPSRLVVQEFQQEQAGSRPGTATKRSPHPHIEIFHHEHSTVHKQPPQQPTPQPHKQKGGAGGIFANKNLASKSSSGGNDMMVTYFTGQLQAMQLKIDQQNDLIQALYQQFQLKLNNNQADPHAKAIPQQPPTRKSSDNDKKPKKVGSVAEILPFSPEKQSQQQSHGANDLQISDL